VKRVLNGKDLPFTDIFPMRTDKKCRRCEKDLAGKQRSWCSDKCANTAFAEVMTRRGNPQFLRKALVERDKEICAKCGLDCAKIKRIWYAASRAISDLHYSRKVDIAEFFGIHIREVLSLGYLEHFEKIWTECFRWDGRDTYWHADHIVELRHNGTHDLDNLQTLCLVCHKQKTKGNYAKPE